MYVIVTPQQFLHQARKLFQKHLDLRAHFVKIIGNLQHAPFQPHIELHALSGKLNGYYAVKSDIQLPHYPDLTGYGK